MPAPLKGKRESVPLSECYYQTEEIRTILGDSSPYLDALLVESMLDACEVTHRLDANTLIKRLKQLKQSQSGTAKQVQAIYRALEGRTWESGEDLIRKSFEDDGLIRLTGAHKGWFSPSEVAWQSNGHFLDSLYPPIQANYKDFQGFFIDKLKVPRVLPLEKWVEALAHLDQISDQPEREAEALAIYKRAEKGLKPLFGREVQPPNWIETFKDEAVYIDHRGELVANDDGLYANDAPWLADLFRDEEGLSLLAVPSDEIPRLNRLLTASGVARLSQAASVEVEKIDDGNLDNELTLRLQKAVPYFARILYSRFSSEFESAMENGALNALWELQVIEVPEVKLQVELGDFHCKATIDAALSHGRIYYRVGVRSLKDRVAAELSKHLVGTTNLADTYARVLMEPDDEGIEEFLLVSSIGQLPADLENAVQQRQLLGTDDTENSEAEAFEGDSSIDDIQDEFQDDVRTTTQIVQQSEPESVTDGHATSVETNRSIDVPHSEQGESSQHSNPSSTSVSHERREPSAAPSVESIATTTRKFSPRNKAAENATDNSLPPANSKQGETPNPGASTITGKFHRTSTARNSPARSRSGRLLSYVETTDNTDRVTLENDATRAAARDATSKAAVAHVLRSLAGRWASMTEMPHNNKGFDILAKTAEGVEEYIEVKGQSGAWTHEGVALTPMELLMAHEQDGHYCLCVVEFAQDDKRRQIHLVRNPFSLVSQFRFDVGWKGAAETITSAPSVPEKGMYIDIADVGVGRIISAKRKGEFYRVHVILQTGKQVNASFHPAKMTLSLEPLWQE